jgi:hypothetical protein
MPFSSKVNIIIKSEDEYITNGIIEQIIDEIKAYFHLDNFFYLADFTWSLKDKIEPTKEEIQY